MAAVAVGCCAFLIAFAVLVFGGNGDRVSTAASDIGQGLAALFAAVMCLRVGPRTDRRGWVAGWRLIGYGALAWLAGQCVWSYYEVIRQVPGPGLSLADVGFLLMVPLILWGLGRLIGLYRAAPMGLIEGLLIAGSLFYLSWVAVLGSLRGPAGRGELLQLADNIAYPVGDVAIASAALILLGSSRPGHRAPVALLAASMLALSVSDSAYVATAQSYRTGHVFDLGWLIGFLLLGLAGAVARGAPRGQPAAAAGSARGWTWLPYVPLSIAAFTSIGLAMVSHQPSVILSVLLVVLFGLVVARQLFALRERHELAGDLQSTLHRVRQQQEILNQLAFSDPLTGLANRALFEERITPTGQLRKGVTTAMFVDLDNFKDVNDAYGHDVGDAVLVETALRLRACCRGEDTVARVGGDEFVVIAAGLPAGAVERVAHRFLTAMRQPVDVGTSQVAVSASIGTATGDTRELDVHELIRRADAAMYIAKMSGRGRHAVYTEPAGSESQPTRQPPTGRTGR